MTDNEIIKGLEICSNNGDCKECPINPHHGNYGYCTSLAIKAALDLINRQKAEIDRLRYALENECDHCACELLDQRDKARAEAIKEFAERAKDRKYLSSEWSHGGHPYVVEVDDIDDLVEEMTE